MLETPSVEYNLTEHCILRCDACAHACALFPPRLASLQQFTADLTALATVLHSRELRIVGGEPLLHPELLDFLRVARRAGVADAVVLVTNGVLLHQAPEELWDLIDGMWLSVYPEIRTTLSVADCSELAARHGVRLTVQQMDYFLHILLNQRIEDPEGVALIYRECKVAREWSCHTVYEGRYYKCTSAPFMKARLAQLGIAFEEQERDFVALHGNPALERSLAEYLGDPRPLSACAYCLGSSGPERPHRQLDVGGADAWRAEDHREVITAVVRRLKTQPASPSSPGVRETETLPLDRGEILATSGVEELRRRLTTSGAAQERLAVELASVQREIAELRACWSWRITAPARWLVRALRGR